MSTTKASVTYTLLLGVLFFAGCTENSEKDQGKDCTVESAGKTVFYGTPECVAQFKTEQMNGYWLVDFDTSLLFLNKEDLERGSIESAYSLDFLDTPPDEVSALLDSPREKILRVSFEGSKSETPGIYGRVPDLRGGVVVKGNFSIEGEIRDVPQAD